MIGLGSRGFYGLLAVAELAPGWVRREPIQVKDIARRQGIPVDYLGQIMVALKKGNIVEAFRGPGGGYVLGRNPDLISVAEVLEALEGSLLSKEFLQRTKKMARSGVAKNISRVCREAAEAFLKVLASTPISMIAEKNGKEPMFYI
jgi:Rrf2 family protein